MYPLNVPPPTFYHQYTTQFFPGASDGQPRVGNEAGSRMLLSPSKYSYSFRLSGIILGSLILFFSITLLSLEAGRLYGGSSNRGKGDLNTSSTDITYSVGSVDINTNIGNRKFEDRWMWPWSSPALLFSLVFITAAVFGIIGGRQENYSSIFIFFICSLLSIFLVVFLIASYSTMISGWNQIYGTSNENAMPRYARIDKNLSIVCLSVSCVLFIIFLVSLVLSGINIDLCTRKDFTEDNDRENVNDQYKTRFG